MDANDQPQRSRGALGYLLMLSFFFFMMSSSSQDTSVETTLKSALERRQQEKLELEEWHAGNATNFTMPDLLSPPLRDLVSELVVQHPTPRLYFQNVTGFLRGKWEHHNVSWLDEGEHHNVSWLQEGLGSSNITEGVPINATDVEPERNESSTLETRRGTFGWEKGGKITMNLLESKVDPEVEGLAVVRVSRQSHLSSYAIRLLRGIRSEREDLSWRKGTMGKMRTSWTLRECSKSAEILNSSLRRDR